ncbi:MAG TPA: hypothetical protein VG839_06415 [Asticcacaulis sp.]|nr:hypothetical protein [Asticcacaulis sp.]
MKRTLFGILALSLLPSLAFAQPLEWSGVQAVGGLKVGTPYKQFGQWYLPIRADVSGLAGGKTLNSGLVCGSTNVRLDHGHLLLTMNTALAGSFSSGSAKCAPVDLSQIKPGNYDVVYRSPSEPDQALGQIQITP